MLAADTDKNCMRFLFIGGNTVTINSTGKTHKIEAILRSKVKKTKRAKSYCDETAEFASLKKPSLKYKSKDDLSFPCK